MFDRAGKNRPDNHDGTQMPLDYDFGELDSMLDLQEAAHLKQQDELHQLRLRVATLRSALEAVLQDAAEGSRSPLSAASDPCKVLRRQLWWATASITLRRFLTAVRHGVR